MLYVAGRLLGAEGLAGIGDLGIESLDQTPFVRQMRTRRLGDDLLITGKVVDSCSRD